VAQHRKLVSSAMLLIDAASFQDHRRFWNLVVLLYPVTDG
jgi:hypothetical protein